MSRIFSNKISDFQANKMIYGFFYCNDKITKYSKNGDMYLDLLLTDESSSIYGKVWSHPNYFDKNFSTESFVAIKGKVVKYRDRLELNILNIKKANIKLYNRYGFKKQ